MADHELVALLAALEQIRGSGRFCLSGTMPFTPPDIMLPNGDDLALPLIPAQAADIRGMAEGASARATVRGWLLGDGGQSHVRAVLGPALLEKRHRAWFAHRHSLAPDLRAVVTDLLAAEIARPILPYADFARPLPAVVTAKAHLGQLLAFLADPAAEKHAFRLAQHFREELQSFISAHRLDVVHTTVRSTSPHTLLCQKTDASYHRALAQRAADERLLAGVEQVSW